MMQRTPPFALLALVLLGCGDKADDTGDGTAADSGSPDTADTDTDGSTDTDADTDGSTDTDADLAAGCLDTPCALPAVGATAVELCHLATGGAADTAVVWIENRYQSGLGASGIAYTCKSADLVETDCPAMCDAAGLDNPYYNAASQDCSCLSSLPDAADLGAEMIGLICESGEADATVQVGSREAGSRELVMTGTVACRDGAASKGSEACEDMKTLLDTELGTSFTDATDFGGGCSVTDY